jgi:3-dehydroquinate synthase
MKIKSTIHDYFVSFGDYKDFIKETYSNGDIIIKDININYKDDNKIIINIDSNENEKEYNKISSTIEYLIENNFKKSNKIFAIGGGVIQDICGFISSIYYRGVEWVFIPTTLLSQGDSCIGGKTSINFKNFKNQLGNFYPPQKIIIDTKLLQTLPENQIKSGLGEMLHYFIFSSYEDFLFFKEKSKIKDFESLIKRSLQIKKSVIEIDEKEEGIRKLFNYGHTFGHAIESMTNYTIPHGIAVCYGMDISNYISYQMGNLNEKEYLEMKEVFNEIKEGLDLKEINVYEYFEILKKDKKNLPNIIKPILCNTYGNLGQYSFTYDSELIIFLKNYFDNE